MWLKTSEIQGNDWGTTRCRSPSEILLLHRICPSFLPLCAAADQVLLHGIFSRMAVLPQRPDLIVTFTLRGRFDFGEESEVAEGRIP